ncbi:hypothetical protein F3Y22_tig00112285pilonHSYRG00386 [Hibiscus syriacus]|uniref:Uncharacterized protein n=1 Tax=Hibiscus syriacus TaxID=106335 RepID=A0A6A2X1X1_HIBSY|nr:hypothetical protein F3Y22_tig00112285pilonHSYRG00386 [Hibiscus syriacus]
MVHSHGACVGVMLGKKLDNSRNVADIFGLADCSWLYLYSFLWTFMCPPKACAVVNPRLQNTLSSNLRADDGWFRASEGT